MASIVSGFEYDIFISYRHNDNRSGWVTEFVKALQEELAATIKEPLSVYFDSNPYDGLLETHNVDKSLERKLKSLIFIAVISQTYSDTKSFAWQHEFCVFNKLAQADKYDRDIKLSNGNVGSRLLPIRIHDLDPDDKAIIETEIGGVLRAVDFIYKEPGVNRPLKPTDHRNDNQNKTDYRNQVNKVANAIKEIISGILRPTSGNSVSNTVVFPIESEDTRQSIATLPFRNMSNDPAQDYFSDGITENIISQLAGNKQLKIISRTSVMRYKKTDKSAPEIAAELGVKFILEGGVQMQQNKVRINVQLIDAVKDDHVWSKVFNESLDDIFEIQNTVAEVIAKELNASLNPQQQKQKEVPTKNLEAYNLFLKGRHAFNQWSVDGYRTATEYFKQAIAKDQDFKEAYSYLASSYSARMSWNGDLSPLEAKTHIELYLNEAWQRGPTDNDYLTKAFVEFFIAKDFPASEKHLLQAIELNPSNASVLYTYCYLLNMMGRFEEASNVVERAKTIDPLTVAYFNYQIICLYMLGRYEEALDTLKEALQLYPTVVRLYDFLARIYLTIGRYEDVIEAVTSGLRSSAIRPPSMVAYLASAYAGLKNTDKAKELLNELIKRSNANEKGVNIYIVYAAHAMGDQTTAQQYLAKAKQTNDVDLIWWLVDPLLKGLRDQSDKSSADFEAAEQHITKLLNKELPAHQYHNMAHIQDVFQASLTIAKAEQLSEDDTKLLRVAALFHDAGFIHSPKNHEEKGAEIAKEILPTYGFNQQQVEIIYNMILATKLPQSPVTKLEKVLCDADLDYLGRADFYEIGGRLYQEMLEAGVVETEREWNIMQRTFLQSHRYHTNYSKSNRESSKQERLQEIMEKLKNRS
jgi:TolB-like protein/HD superfamily phosphodiesterase/Flp pilus assembly protein TadD